MTGEVLISSKFIMPPELRGSEQQNKTSINSKEIDGNTVKVYPRHKSASAGFSSGKGPITITWENMAQLQRFPLHLAAAKIGLSPTALKHACRKLGINRWAYRRIPGPPQHRLASEPFPVQPIPTLSLHEPYKEPQQSHVACETADFSAACAAWSWCAEADPVDGGGPWPATPSSPSAADVEGPPSEALGWPDDHRPHSPCWNPNQDSALEGAFASFSA